MLRSAINLIVKTLQCKGSIARVFGHSRSECIGACLIVVVAAIGIASLLLLPGTVFCQESEESLISREYPLKALFIYNFAGYVDWPQAANADPKAPFIIGVLGDSPIDETLNQIASSKQIAGRKIVVERFVSINDIKPCQILFVPRSVSAAQQRQVIDLFKNRPVLLVGESDGFASIGGDVNFFIQSNRIRFEVNLAAMRQKELKASSKLLAMAKIVDQGPPQR